MNIAKDERVQTIAMIGGLVGFAGLLIQVAKSKPVANILAQFKNQ